MVLSAVCTFNYFQAIFLQVIRVRVLFTAFCTWLSSSKGFRVVSIFLAFETLQGRWDVLLDSLKTIADLYLLGAMELIKCQDVSVGLDSFFAISSGNPSYIYYSLFSQGWCYILFCNQCQIPIPENSYGNIESLMKVGSAFRRVKGFFNMLSASLQLSTATSKLLSLVFLTIFGVAFAEITFSMRKGKNIAMLTSSRNSITMKLGKSAASFSKSDSDRFRLVFYSKTPYRRYIFLWPCAPPPTTESHLCWEWTKRETHSPWLRRGYATSILKLRVGFRPISNFRFSALVKFLFFQHNEPLAIAFLHLKDKGWEIAASADLIVRLG